MNWRAGRHTVLTHKINKIWSFAVHSGINDYVPATLHTPYTHSDIVVYATIAGDRATPLIPIALQNRLNVVLQAFNYFIN